ncbi:MAG: hypothetical protein P794_00755 [Epsilonproteobacteria bacterium (ex Lamellibrachia satsuma)]|nr:MAG: hypothetical protein P794_00755 [Epsilonproteobacteria bacterium (ex Lamellibrachia satsuma)]
MKKLLFALLSFFSFLHAATGCVLVQPADMNVTWKAYKTLAKLGVGGQFTAVKYTANKLEGKNFRELFVGSTVTIDTSKITTGNPARDETLVKMFFGKLKNPIITAKITDIQKTDKHVKGKPRTGIVSVSIAMNEKTLIIPMKYYYSKGHFQAKGTIDLFDFAANGALASINKSCYDLHKGKTWNDVSISFSTTVKATLCHVDIKK